MDELLGQSSEDRIADLLQLILLRLLIFNSLVGLFRECLRGELRPRLNPASSVGEG